MATNFNLKQTFVGLIIMLLMQETVYAKNLGVYGETFPIDEQDLKEIIYAKLHLIEVAGAQTRRTVLIPVIANARHRHGVALIDVRVTQ